MRDLMYAGHPKTADFLEMFGLEAGKVKRLELSAAAGEMFLLEVESYVENPKKNYTDYFRFHLIPLDWEHHCIGCKYYGFGKYCKLLNGVIPIPHDAYSFYCKSWTSAGADRNMILYRRFTDEMARRI